MAQPGGLCLLALLGLGFGVGGSPACYDPRGLPRRCMPVFENAAFGRAAWATNTCGSPPEDYCQQMGARHASQLCQRCDAADPRLHHNASLLTDFHSQEESTWWQSQSMAFGIQHPNSVNITLRLGRRGKRSLGTGGAEPPGAGGGRWWCSNSPVLVWGGRWDAPHPRFLGCEFLFVKTVYFCGAGRRQVPVPSPLTWEPSALWVSAGGAEPVPHHPSTLLGVPHISWGGHSPANTTQPRQVSPAEI